MTCPIDPDPFADKQAYEAQLRILKRGFDSLLMQASKIQGLALGHVEIDANCHLVGTDLLNRNHDFGVIPTDCCDCEPAGCYTRTYSGELYDSDESMSDTFTDLEVCGCAVSFTPSMFVAEVEYPGNVAVIIQLKDGAEVIASLSIDALDTVGATSDFDSLILTECKDLTVDVNVIMGEVTGSGSAVPPLGKLTYHLIGECCN